MDAVQECRLIKQLSEDIFGSAFQGNGLRPENTGCDSSDCLLCQGQRTFCSKAVTDGVSSYLGKRLSGVNEPADGAASLHAPSDHSSAAEQKQQPCSKRPKRDAAHALSESEDQAAAAKQRRTQQQQHHEQQHQQPQQPDNTCCISWTATSGGVPWQWREEFAARELPAPSKFVEVATLQQPSGACSGSPVSCRQDMICGLEFSTDGQLLAAAGVNKQIALYPVAAMQQQQLDIGGPDEQQQRRQHAGTVPCLPPVALVRLPGKVSSIAWSPDIEGVLSVGDYDGTLTQVHVTSGHYLNEVDAHAGRRIWSISHSRLIPHLAATASDDHTAKLWSGRGLAAAAATITLPGKPAVCCADFCTWHEHLLALAAADHRVYLYDLRRLAQPLATLSSHKRAVSYAKFFGPGQLVSASIDGTLAAWNLPAAFAGTAAAAAAAATGDASSTGGWSSSCSNWTGQAICCSCGCGSSQQQQQQASRASGLELRGSTSASLDSALLQQQQQQQETTAAPLTSSSSSSSSSLQPWKVFQGHRNEKNFVGLALEPSAGLMAVGSESSEVFAYHTSWSSPLAKYCMLEQLTQPAAVTWQQHHTEQQQQQQRSVCAVAWQPPVGCGANCSSPAGCAAPLLAAASSAGDCRLLLLQDP